MRTKLWLAQALQPVMALHQFLVVPLKRTWAFAHLRHHLGPAVDPTVVIEDTVELHGTHDIELGRYIYLYPSLYWETRESGRISIGDGVVMSRGVHVVSHARITIGEGTMIGEYTSIRDANHRRNGEGVQKEGHDASPIHIGKHVWIGRGVTVLPGVDIGDGAVIAANAVVSHSVPAGTVVGGIPARHIQAKVAA